MASAILIFPFLEGLVVSTVVMIISLSEDAKGFFGSWQGI